MTRYSGLLLCLSVLAHAMANTPLERKHVRKASVSQNERNIKQDDVEARIVGGTTATQGRFPYMVTLWSDNRHECGGVLVAPDLVLTAAHCTWNGYNNPGVEIITAKVGQWDKTDDSEPESEIFAVTQHAMHSWYNPGTDEFDVGLLKLESTSSLPTVTINNGSSDYYGGMLTVLGWGDLGDGTFPDELQQVNVKYIPDEACRSFPDPLGSASYESYIYDDMICAFSPGKDGCFGDSGGPLLKRGNLARNDVVVGITSWGIGCARMPGVYARVDYVDIYNWIAQNICELSDDPPSFYNCDETTLGDPPSDSLRDDPNPNPPLSPPGFSPPGLSPPLPTPEPTPEPTPLPTPEPTPNPAPGYSVGVSLPPAYSVGVVLPPAFEPPTEDRSIDKDEQEDEDTHDDEREGMIWMEEATPSNSFARRRCVSCWTVAAVLSLVVVAGVAL